MQGSRAVEVTMTDGWQSGLFYSPFLSPGPFLIGVVHLHFSDLVMIRDIKYRSWLIQFKLSGYILSIAYWASFQSCLAYPARVICNIVNIAI